MRRSIRLSILLLLAPLALYAEQTPLPPHNVPDPFPKPASDDNLLGKLNWMLRNNKKTVDQGAEGFGTVDARHARLCPICLKPLYLHSDPNFECIPIDEKGVPIKVLRVQYANVQCPICGASFSAALQGNVNDKDGRDRDYCAHSVGKVCVHSTVSMCPNCGYAALTTKFATRLDGSPIDDRIKALVHDKLSAITRTRMIKIAGLNPKTGAQVPPELLDFASYVGQTEIPDWCKYHNALRIYAEDGVPHAFLAPLYLEGAHACRREVASEIAVPGLHNDLQVALGNSICRINAFLRDECLSVRRRQNLPLNDPTKPEIDQKILAAAAQGLVQRAEEEFARARSGAPVDPGEAAEAANFTTGDLFVLHIRHAGILDRLGRCAEADAALDKALSCVPEKLTVLLDNKENSDLEDYLHRQLQLLRGVVNDRKECLKREQDFMFDAARENMAAIKFNEIVPGEEQPATPGQARIVDPALTAYMLGELLRRGGEPAASTAWFTAATRILKKKLAALDEKEKAAKDQATAMARLDDERERWLNLQDWTNEQQRLVRSNRPLDNYVRDIINVVLAGANLPPLTADALEITAPAQEPAAGPTAAVGGLKAPAAPAAAPNISAPRPAVTREKLYQAYYQALLKYREAKKENPAKLSELVDGGFITQAECCLDAKSKLICPETTEWLGYIRNWEPGDANAPVLYSITKPGSKALFANGEIREGVASRK